MWTLSWCLEFWTKNIAVRCEFKTHLGEVWPGSTCLSDFGSVFFDVARAHFIQSRSVLVSCRWNIRCWDVPRLVAGKCVINPVMNVHMISEHSYWPIMDIDNGHVKLSTSLDFWYKSCSHRVMRLMFFFFLSGLWEILWGFLSSFSSSLWYKKCLSKCIWWFLYQKTIHISGTLESIIRGADKSVIQENYQDHQRWWSLFGSFPHCGCIDTYVVASCPLWLNKYVFLSTRDFIYYLFFFEFFSREILNDSFAMFKFHTWKWPFHFQIPIRWQSQCIGWR